VEPKLIPLETLLRWLWEDNPKLHQDVMLTYSMNTFGFNDRVGVCSKFTLVMSGHGRLGNLKRLKDLWAQQDPNVPAPPTNIVLDDVLGDWLVPCEDHDQFESREQAYQYALLHNRSGVAALDLRDYDITRLQRALKSAAAGQQMELLGFEADDFAQGSTGLGISAGATIAAGGGAPSVEPGVAPVGQLPKTAIFDPASLPDTPTYQPDQAPQSFVVMITAPDAAAFQKMLTVLTLSERKTVPEGTRFASVEGMKYMPQWEKYLVAQEPLVVKQSTGAFESIPLPGQLTLAGEVVQETDLTGLTLIAGAEQLSEPATPVAKVKVKPPAAPAAPNWDEDGNCLNCGGKGQTGTRVISGVSYKVYCTACDGAATRVVWEERHLAAGG